MSITDGSDPIRSRLATGGGDAVQPTSDLGFGGLTGLIPEPISVLPFPGPIVGLNPAITDAIPRSGAPGTQVVILGSNLPFDGDLRFNGVPAFYTFVSTTRIETQVPAGASTGRITINGVQSPFDFVVGAPSTAPTIAGFSPTGGRPGDLVTISGTNLDRVTEVRFNGVRADPPFIFSSQIIQATVPQGATSGPITVIGPSGSATGSMIFTVGMGFPSITSFSPAAGAPGTQVDIFGTELGGANRVTFNGADAQFFVLSNAQVRATVPGFAGSGPIRVHTPLGIAVSATNFFAGSALPRFDSFTPTSGRPGDIVTLNGADLNSVTRVRFGSVIVPALSRPSNQQITLTVPDGAVTAPIFLESDAGTVQGPGVFTVLPPATTTVTSISPTQGLPGIAVTINGTGLLRVTGVFFAPGIPADGFGAQSDTLLRAFPPSGAVTGPIRLDTPTGPVFTPVFTILGDPVPTVAVLNPGGGQQFNAGQVISVDWFAGDNGTIVSQDIRYSPDGGASFQTLVPGLAGTARNALVQLPNAASSNALISVTARDNVGQVGEGRSGIFRVVGDAPPAVTVLSPNGGEQLTAGQIVPVNWNSSDDVGLASHDVRFSTDGGATWQDIVLGIPGFRRTVQWTVPDQPSDRCLVSVIARDTSGNATEDRSDGFFRIVRVPVPAPVISAVEPNQGPPAGGTNVVVRGANFPPGARVRFGGTDAATVFVSSAQLNAVTPPAAAAGPVQVAVVNPDGQRAVLEGGFTYLSAIGEPVQAQLRLVSATIVDPEPDPTAGFPDEDAYEPDGIVTLASAEAGLIAEPVLQPAPVLEPAFTFVPETTAASTTTVPMPIKVKAGEMVTFGVLAELFDMNNREVFNRELVINFDPARVPPDATLQIPNPGVTSFTFFEAVLKTSVNTPPGRYVLLFQGATVLQPLLFTPPLFVEVEVLEPTRRVKLAVTPDRQVVPPGGLAIFDVMLDRKNLKDVPVRLLPKDPPPPGVVVTFEPRRPTGRTAKMMVQTPPDIGPGDIPIVVTARTNVMLSKVVNATAIVTVQPVVQVIAQTVERRIAAGMRAEYELTLSRMGLIGAAVRLEVDPATLPPFATASFEPATPTGDTAVLRIDTTDDTPAGTSTVAIRGAVDVPGGLVRGATVLLVVNAAPTVPANGTLTLGTPTVAEPDPADVAPAGTTVPSVRAGGSIAFRVTPELRDAQGNPLADEVRLAVTGLPASATAAIAPNPGQTEQPSQVTVQTATATPPGDYTLTVTGESVRFPGVTYGPVQVPIRVRAALRRVKLAVSPTSAVLRPGGSARFTVSLNRTNATGVIVRLRANGNLPQGTTFAFTPTSTTTTRSTLVVTVPSTAPAGIYAFTVVGTTGTAGVTIEPSAPPTAVRVERLLAVTTATAATPTA